MLILFAVLRIPLTVRNGTYGTAVALAIMGLPAQCLTYIMESKVLGIDGRSIFRRVVIPLFAAIAPGTVA